MPSCMLEFAARLLRNGGVIGYPTEAVYGLGCQPMDPAAVARILYLKRRAVSKGLILIGCSLEQLAPFVADPDSAFSDQVLASWPGPVTWIFDASPRTPGWLTGYRGTIALRLTSHPIAARLCRLTGQALVSTSANLSGRTPAKTALATRIQFNANLDYIVKGEVGKPGRPTEIRVAATNELVRAGTHRPPRSTEG